MLAPARCISCLREDSWLCNTCLAKIRPYQQSCIMCSEPHPSGRTCPDCTEDTLLAGVLSAAPYSAPYIQRSIKWLKFKSIRPVAPSLAFLLSPYLPRIAPLAELQQHSLIIPIPLHKKRHRHRGFNQAEEIARALSESVHISIHSALERTRHTHAQAKLPKALRKENMRGAFKLSAPIPGTIKQVILVDDVITSGTTLSVAAHTIQKGSPNFSGQIWGLSIARG